MYSRGERRSEPSENDGFTHLVAEYQNGLHIGIHERKDNDP